MQETQISLAGPGSATIVFLVVIQSEPPVSPHLDSKHDKRNANLFSHD